jgi:hypothetical protein
MALVVITVVRPIFLEGRTLAAGEQAEVPPALAAELVAAGKARRGSAPAPVGPLTTDSADALVAGRRRKRGDPE